MIVTQSVIVYHDRLGHTVYLQSLTMHLPRVAVCMDAVVFRGVWRNHDGAVFIPEAASVI